MNPTFEYSPTVARKNAFPFVQTLRVADGGKTVASARWMLADPAEGVIQLLDLRVEPGFQRQGWGRRTLDACLAQCGMLPELSKKPARRVFALVGQKKQVIARAFFTARGFHHVSTLSELHRDEDLLVYVRSLN